MPPSGSAPSTPRGSSEDNPIFFKEVKSLSETLIGSMVGGAGSTIGKFFPELALEYIKGKLHPGTNLALPSADDLKRARGESQEIAGQQRNIRNLVIGNTFGFLLSSSYRSPKKS